MHNAADAPGGSLRMRPGDWSCASCGNHNFASRLACNKCGAAKALASGGCAVAGYGPAATSARRRASPYATAVTASSGLGSVMRPGDWACPACGNHNYASRAVCNRCKAPKALDAAPAGGSGSMRPGDWNCLLCGNHNYASRAACNRCQAPKNSMPEETAAASHQQLINQAWAGMAQAYGFSLDLAGQGWAGQDYTAALVQAMELQALMAQGASAQCQVSQPGEGSMCGVPKTAHIARSGMRPGDWLCPRCDNHNFAGKEACNRCLAPRGSAQLHTEGMREGDWLCAACGNHNYRDKVVCNKCSSPKTR